MATSLGVRLTSKDVAFALCFVVAALIEAVVQAWERPAQLAATGPGVLVWGALVFSRSRPLLAMTALAVSSSVGVLVQQLWLLPPAGDAFVPLIGLTAASYCLGAYGSRRAVALGSIQPVLLVLEIDLTQPSNYPLPGALLFFALFIVALPIVAGRVVRARVHLVGCLRAQEVEIEAHHLARTREVVAQEWLQVADRLQATLLSGMESLGRQVAFARTCEDRRQQVEAVAAVESDARALLSQTRGLVVSLHTEDLVATYAGEPESEPRPGPTAQATGSLREAAMPWLAIAASAVCLGMLFETRRAIDVGGAMPLALLGCFLVAGALALTWSHPVLMTTVLWSATAAFSTFVIPLGELFTPIALTYLSPFAVALLSPRRGAVVGFGVVSLGELVSFGPSGLVWNVVVMLAAWIVGRVVRDRSRLVETLRRNNGLLEQARQFQLRQAIVAERARLARDVHDAIGHSLTVIALQAGAVRRMGTSDSTRAGEVLATIERVATLGLIELREGFAAVDARPLRDSQQALGLADIGGLVEGARAGGLSVEIHADEADPNLPVDIELAIYRVAQEALTNVLKHAPGARTQLMVRVAAGLVELIVVNGTGGVPATDPLHLPQGLCGMRQRVETSGGRLVWGARPEGGFEVRAQFPVPVRVPASA